MLPFNLSKARNGVKIRLDADRRRTATILLEQRDAGTAILESAGRANQNPLGDALGSIRPGTTRVLGPALYSKKGEVENAMREASLKVVQRVESELR